MTNTEFWEIVQRSLDRSGDDLDRQADELRLALEALPPEEIVSFDRHIDAYRDASYSNDLWGAAYIIGGGCSEDGFEYFRRWLISRGQEWFEKALNHSDALAGYPQDLSDLVPEFEEFAYIAPRVYEAKTGAEFPYGRSEAPVLKGASWDDDETVFQERWPKLFAKYW